MWSCPARQTKRNFDTRLFGFDKNHSFLQNLVNTVQKIGFQTCGRFMLFFELFFEKVDLSQKCPRSVWEVSGTTPDLFWTNSDHFGLKIA